MNLIKPQALKKGDLVAAVSLSWGGAGDPLIRWRYEQGKAYIEDVLGLKVIEYPHTLKGSEWVYLNPKARAKDLMDAFENPEVKAIFSCIGGDDSIRLLPYIDFDVIKNHPKICLGFSDTTILHLFLVHAGVTSFYGPAILSEFAENGGMFDYTKKYLKKALFEKNPIGLVHAPSTWTGDRIEWLETHKHLRKTMVPHEGILTLQGKKKVFGKLFGGCIEVLEFAKGTKLMPSLKDLENSILFFETSEDQITPSQLEYMLRSYGILGILQQARGVLFGKPYQNIYFNEYQVSIIKIFKEFSLTEIPILYNCPFGHTEPMMTIPYGAMASIDPTNQTFEILESSVS